MNTYHLHFQGIVQGVGFRPHVYKLALDQGLNGNVNNTVDGVHIMLNGTREEIENFKNTLLESPPVLSRITNYSVRKIGFEQFDDFQIITSSDTGKRDLLITPDIALCEDCKRELNTHSNHRFHYPFITCTNCGPRYSIMKSLPYDRDKTTMDPFIMCSACDGEYNDPLDRRHYSQTNSCPDCKISLSYYRDSIQMDFNQEEIINHILQDWRSGKIVAIKGIGGYLLTCDATNEKSIWTLRSRKLRPKKPFALMYPSKEILEKDAWISEKAKTALDSVAAPIVLLPLHNHPESGIATELINPGLDRVGAMLPYTPLYEMLLSRFKRPIVATSGNLSGSPIIYEDRIALKELSHIADVIVSNDRDIMVPQDDSVISLADVTQQKIILRRSRGLAPSHIDPKLDIPEKEILAMGADMKSVFAITHGGNLFVSQYLGDLDSFLSQLSFERANSHFKDLLGFNPEIILVDSHPSYYSSSMGKQLADENSIPLLKIQHHKAHFASVLGENHLINSEEKILGVIWDGLGYGEDGSIWGGEWFEYDNGQFERVFHLPYFDYFMQDKMSREPRLSALSLLKNIPEHKDVIKGHFNQREWDLYSRLIHDKDHIQTSSMGRLFDAVSCLLLGIDRMDFQGEAAMHLEQAARHYFYKHNPEHKLTYLRKSLKDPLNEILRGVITDLLKEKPVELIAARFHISLVDLIFLVGRKLKIDSMAFSGGVFQNALLVDLIKVLARDNLKLYFHNHLSPNDESISFGQLMYYQINQNKSKLKESETLENELL